MMSKIIVAGLFLLGFLFGNVSGWNIKTRWDEIQEKQ